MSDVTVIGNVGEPQLKFTRGGKAVLEFSLAENHSKKNQQGEWESDGTTWRKVTLWERKAEALGEVLAKGNKVIVTGQERIREWETQDGKKGQTLELAAREVGIIAMPPRNNQQQGGRGNQSGDWGAPQEDPWATPGVSNNGGWGNGPDSEPPF